MTQFIIELAGVPIEVNALFGSTKKFAKEYAAERRPLFSVSITQDRIEKIRKQAEAADISEGRPPEDASDSYLETLALADAVLEKLIDYNIVLVHGSVVAVGGKAYLFTAKSGTGKTTHSRLWLKNIPGCHILNGDKPLLQFSDGKIYACGSPWCGKERYGINETLPLAAICILERDTKNHIEKIELKDGFSTLVHQCYIPNGKGAALTFFNLMKQFSNVELFRLGCNMEDEAALVSYNAMVKA